ncbi:unnamed protein product [Brassica rapa]|uniref:Uncharacterized protein n=2 Tax=Brassica TaxID=3705 RepID=A0A8D9M5G2_BRACM|nr:unnamed protein product [Brassica napus]CAG7899392.1 unnamed protein product [Brassica rapa]
MDVNNSFSFLPVAVISYIGKALCPEDKGGGVRFES